MSAEILYTPLGWVAFALVFGAVPIYAAFRSGYSLSHIDQHRSSMRSSRLASEMPESEPKVRVVSLAPRKPQSLQEDLPGT